MKKLIWGGIAACLIPALCLQAQVRETFNARNGVKTNQVKSYLHNNCWLITHFDVIPASKNSTVKGNGVLVSSALSGATLQTPLLKISDGFMVSFSYRYKSNFYNHAVLKLSLESENGESKDLDEIDLRDNNDQSILYEEQFSTPPQGAFKLVLSFYQPDDNGMITVDELVATAPLYYESGCNNAPRALADVVEGNQDRTAFGSLVANDNEENKLSAFVISESPDGKITLDDKMNFAFVPNGGFRGKSTRFSYRACDTGPGNLCSDETWVTIRFPEKETLPVALLDFSGMYLQNGKIALNWTTTHVNQEVLYQIERSTDGKEWKKVGEIKAEKSKGEKKKYQYIDIVSTNIANKKDLYYRLRQVNGNEVLTSRLLVLRVYNTPSLKMVSVTPNPVKKDIGMRIDLNQEAIIVLRIYNNAGTAFMHRNIRATTGVNNYLMDGSSNLIPGIYFLEIIVNSKERMIVSLVKE